MALIIRLIAVMGFVVIAALTARSFLGPGQVEAVAPAEPKTLVRVASKNLAVGTFLDETEAPFSAWTGPVRDDMLVDPVPKGQDVIGAVIIAPIASGEPISRTQLLLPGQDGFLAAVLEPGMRAASIAVDAVSGNAGHIFPGDRVDLILTQTLNKHRVRTRLAEQWASETILENIRVIAVDQDMRADLTQRDGASHVARTITLEVRPEDAEKVALASGLGKLSLSLRSLLVPENAQASAALPSAGQPVAASPALPESAIGRRAPTWAGDVSLVLRAASQPEAARPAAGPSRGIKVFRGKETEDVRP